MGRIKKGILGGFSGTVGTVVGANWKSISYMRSRAQKVKDPRTEAQLKQRSKLTLVMKLLKPLTPALRVGWKNAPKNKSPFNSAMAHMMKNPVFGTYPNYQVNIGQLLISTGGLEPARNGRASQKPGGFMEFTWDDNSGVRNAKATDKAILVVLNITKMEAVVETHTAERSNGIHRVKVPASNWAYSNIISFIGFVSDDGKEVANSVRLGQFTMLNY
jgi:hypothetical protein